jgi:hypothetical protein
MAGGGDAQPLLFEVEGEAVLEEPGAAAPEAELWWGDYAEETAPGLPAEDAITPAQKMLTALEAAKYRALAALAAQLDGVQVKQESRVLNMQFAGEGVEGRTDATVRGFAVVSAEWDDDSQIAEVTVRSTAGQSGPAGGAGGVAPPSLAIRRIRAEHAARVNAMAKLSARIGEVRVGQEVKVRDLVLVEQRAWLVVDGVLEGAQLSEPEWRGEETCVVKAWLRVSERDLERLQAMAGMRDS